MQKIIHLADSRGHADHGWLNTHHTFSFASYYDPERVHFGVLRVLNDDIVSAGMGFGAHPHDNMEIVSIPLEGALEHHDSMGNSGVIQSGDVQIMSAGTGIQHSEFNHSKSERVAFLQIWVFPAKRNITPRYDQRTFPANERKNAFQAVVSPIKDTGLWINQNAWFFLADPTAGNTLTYDVKEKGNGVYIFVIAGSVEIDGTALHARDGMGITDATEINISATADARILVMEVPMIPEA
ncbi:MAG: pirin family protein [Chitinophagales bacterium]